MKHAWLLIVLLVLALAWIPEWFEMKNLRNQLSEARHVEDWSDGRCNEKPTITRTDIPANITVGGVCKYVPAHVEYIGPYGDSNTFGVQVRGDSSGPGSPNITGNGNKVIIDGKEQ